MSTEKGFIGGQSNMVPATYVSRTATADMAVGIPVSVGVTENLCVPATDGTKFLGITASDAVHGAYKAGETVRILTEGVIYVTAAATVSQGAAVGFSAAGAFATASSTTYKYQIQGACFDASAQSGELVPIRLNGSSQVTTL